MISRRFSGFPTPKAERKFRNSQIGGAQRFQENGEFVSTTPKPKSHANRLTKLYPGGLVQTPNADAVAFSKTPAIGGENSGASKTPAATKTPAPRKLRRLETNPGAWRKLWRLENSDERSRKLRPHSKPARRNRSRNPDKHGRTGLPSMTSGKLRTDAQPRQSRELGELSAEGPRPRANQTATYHPRFPGNPSASIPTWPLGQPYCRHRRAVERAASIPIWPLSQP